MGAQIEIQTSDGNTIGAYLARPSGRAKGSIVVLQEIFGVNDHIRDIADRLAAEGYLSIAPQLFDRVRRNVELGYEQSDHGTARETRAAVNEELAVIDIHAAIDRVSDTGKPGMLGFCWGGTLAFKMAVSTPSLSAAVCFYGAGIADIQGQAIVPTMLHFGEQDHAIPMADVDRVRETHPETELFTYPAGHGFNCDKRASYESQSASVAWQRSLDFFKTHTQSD